MFYNIDATGPDRYGKCFKRTTSNTRYKFAIIIGTESIKIQMEIINSRLVNSLDNGSTSVTSSEITGQFEIEFKSGSDLI